MLINMEEIEKFVDSHIGYIRRMALLTDDQLKYILKAKISQDPELLEKFREHDAKKQINELTQMAKNIKAEPLKLARKVA